MSTDTPVHTRETELLTPHEMLLMVVDWTGGCQRSPGNADVIEALLQCGVEKQRLILLSHALTNGMWTRYAAASLVMEMLSASRVRAAVALHGHRYHDLSLMEARRDVRSLRAEAREIAQREILMSVPRPANEATA